MASDYTTTAQRCSRPRLKLHGLVVQWSRSYKQPNIAITTIFWQINDDCSRNCIFNQPLPVPRPANGKTGIHRFPDGFTRHTQTEGVFFQVHTRPRATYSTAPTFASRIIHCWLSLSIEFHGYISSLHSTSYSTTTTYHGECTTHAAPCTTIYTTISLRLPAR
jgi:hypothetical protein